MFTWLKKQVAKVENFYLGVKMGLYTTLSHIKDNSQISLITRISDASHILVVDGKKKYVDDKLKDVEISSFDMENLGKQKIGDEDYFVDLLAKETTLVVCGGGHVAQSVVKFAKKLNFKIIGLEDRLSFARALTIAGADEVIYEEFEDGIKKISGSLNTYFAIVTRGHRYDIACLHSILEKPYAYIGMLSSHYRAASTKKRLIKEKFNEDVVNSIHAPIGLNISAVTPDEIAIAILGEIIQIKNSSKKRSDFTSDMLNAIVEKKEKKVLCTIINAKGSTPRGAGTKMLVLEDGSIMGSVGGGCMEAEVKTKALEIMRSEKMALVRIDMTGRQRDIENDGMACGGIVDVLIEPVKE